jgi:eukaryotic-like serine/threonine-protein kinase
MEYVEGEDLQQVVDRNGGRGLPIAQAMNWLPQVVEAVKYLHQQTPPIIHRDIKPENIRVSPNGQIKLVDFGIAKIYSAGFSTTLGARAIAPGYSPLEQYAGHGRTDIRSDVYALGATLYTLLTGTSPTESVMRYSQQLPPPIQLNPTLLPTVQDVILRSMDMEPDQRYQNVDDMWRDFRRAATLMPSNAAVVTDTQKRQGAQLRMRRALQSGDSRRIAAAYYPEVREVYLTFSVEERRVLENALTQYSWLVAA